MIGAVFDTSIIVDHLRNFKKATELLRKVRNKEIIGYISTLTEAELFAGEDSADEQKRLLLSQLIFLFNKVHVDNEISQKAGEYRRKYDIPLADGIIAATAAVQKLKLWTKNLEDFKNIGDIEIEKPY